MKLLNLVGLAALIAGGYFFYNHFQIQGIENLKIKPKNVRLDGPSQPGAAENPVPVAAGAGGERAAIRVASINLRPLDQDKLGKAHVVGRLAEMIRGFDVIAIQGIVARNQSPVVYLVEQVNAAGRHYDFATSANVGTEPVQEYTGILFDRATVEIDRTTICLVEDPSGRIRHEPLVASFRARGPAPTEAFTFSLVSVDVDPGQAATELDLMDDVFRAVRDDGRGEDDVILVGYLNADDQHLGQLAEVPNITWAISGLPTTTRGTRLSQNILFEARATNEFSGRSGVMDLMRQFNLSLRDAVEISDHLPVWAEFSVYEAGQAGHIVASGGMAAR
ncbi:MAG: endonuclease/exonuclease/phosphatase [Pirellulales bacterium]|nr:endonuclease/exonuclease/phosphatase [Pirellulales bacterium]